MKIGFTKLKILCAIGVYAEEKLAPQELLISCSVKKELATDYSRDCLKETVDYTLLAQVCQAVANRGHFHLLEKLAYEILQEFDKCFSLSWAKVTIEKPQALKDAESCFVEIETNFKQDCR